MLIITSKKPGFRRCGVAHPAEPTDHPDGTFTPEQVAALHIEPMLVVIEALGAAEAEAVLTNKPAPAADMIALVKKAESIGALDNFAAGETRKTVLEAVEARRKELEA